MLTPVLSHPFLVSAAALAGFYLLGAPAFAQTHIGGAVAVKNEVRGQTQGKTQQIALGDRVFQNEVVRTGADSLARFMLLDETNVALGPTSQITLDRFVYDPDAGAKTVTLSAAKGAFRFISGRSPHEAYEVRTPQASIGVRGTTYDVRILNGRTTVVLQEGAVNVCRRGTAQCAELTQPGQSLVVTDRGIEGPFAPERKTWDFGSLCATSSAICGHTTQFAFNDARPQARPAAPRPPKAKSQPARPRFAAAEQPRPQNMRPRRPLPVYDDMDEDIIIRRPVIATYPIGFIGPDHSIGFGWRGHVRPRQGMRVPGNPGILRPGDNVIGFGRIGWSGRNIGGRGFGAMPMRGRIAGFRR